MSPDLNAATGPKQPSSPIRLVLGKFDPDRSEHWDTAFTCFELDTGLWFGLSAARRARYRKRFHDRGISLVARTVLRPIRDPEILTERLMLIEEELQGSVCLHSISNGRRRFELEPEEQWIPSIQGVLRECKIPVALEWGEGDSLRQFRRWVADFSRAGWMIDPDFHEVKRGLRPECLHFKLHGWHPDRWVRRYGENRATELIDRIKKSGVGSLLVLSHSGRFEEFGVFSEAIEGGER